MKIVRVQRKDEKNVTIYFDNDEKLIISEDVFYNSGLRKGDELSDDRYTYFIEQNKLYHIKQRALSFLSRRFHSEKELYLKLRSKAYEDKLIREVLIDLSSHSFINDKNFAHHFIDEKLKKKKWGINKIKSALFTKGVSTNIIDEALSEFENPKNDSKVIYEIAMKKVKLLKKRNIEEKKIYPKVVQFLISRGFEYKSSKQVCIKILKSDFD